MTLPYPPPFQDLATLSKSLGVSHDDIPILVSKGALPQPTPIKGEQLWRWSTVETFVATKRKPGMIYFIECGDFIKIGFTYSIDARMRSFRGANPYELTLLHKMRGTLAREAELLAQFSHLRHRGEWFHKDPEIVHFITKLRRR